MALAAGPSYVWQQPFDRKMFVANRTFTELEWPYIWAIKRLALAMALGFFVGLERQRRGKDAGVRTFAFCGLLGSLGGLLGDHFALMALAMIGIIVILLAMHSLKADHGTEVTTSAALAIIGYSGVMCGQGHTLTPTAVGVMTAAMLAWKESFAGLSLGLTEAELRSAILLAILAFVIYPALPEGAIDSWGLIEPRAAWVTVLLISGMGFGNYILLKLYGSRAVELTGFLGGLVNSTVTVTALATSVKKDPSLTNAAYRGILLATAAMLMRNAVLLAILAPMALLAASPSLILMLVICAGLLAIGGKPMDTPPKVASSPLHSPFSLSAALKFGLLFLMLKVVGSLAQSWLGQFGFYAVSFVGGFVSSASAVASAGALVSQGTIASNVAGVGAVVASIASALVNLPLVARIGHEKPLNRRTGFALGLIVGFGMLGALGVMLVSRYSNGLIPA